MSQLTVLGWPMSTQYAALPIASAITMVFVAWDLVQIMQGRKPRRTLREQRRMILFQTFGVFIIFTLLGVPLVYGLLLSTAGMIWYLDLSHPLTSVFLSLHRRRRAVRADCGAAVHAGRRDFVARAASACAS